MNYQTWYDELCGELGDTPGDITAKSLFDDGLSPSEAAKAIENGDFDEEE